MFWLQYYRNGKPYRESTCSKKETEAKRFLQLREGQIAEGKFPGLRVGRICFEELAEDLIMDYKTNSRKSLKSVHEGVNHLKKHFGGCRIRNITSCQIKDIGNIEKYGSGIYLENELCLKNGNEKPVYEITVNQTKVLFKSQVKDVTVIEFDEKVLEELNERQRKALEYFKNKKGNCPNR